MKPINPIPSLISSIQSNKILQKLQKQKEEGVFRSEKEYNDELKNSLINITKRENQPVFQYTAIVDGVAHSEYVNNAMDAISLDLEVAFSEINYLFSKIAAHQAFYDKTIFEVQGLLNKLERNLEAISIQASLDTIYNKVEYNSFLDKSKRLALGSILAAECYYDSRAAERTRADSLGEINVLAGELSLPKFSETRVSISSISIVTTETTVSDFDIQIPGITPANLISDDSSDVWSYNILSRKRLTTPATLALDVDLGDKKETNQLFVSPNASIPCIIKAIYYYDENGEEISLGIETETLTEDRLYTFPKIIARRFKIVLEQDRNKLIPFDLNAEGVTLSELQRDSDLDANILSIATNVMENIKDPNIKNILGINQNSISNTIILFNYAFSLASIRIGLTDYKSKGVFVGTPVRFNKPTIVGLEAGSRIPTVKDTTGLFDLPCGSVEYSFIKKDYSSAGRLLKSTDFNILPLGESEVKAERLFFNLDKIIPLRFLAHSAAGDASSVVLYRDGVELIRGVDWVFPDRLTQANLEDFTVLPVAGNTKVEILHTDEQVFNGVYCAKYIPRYALDPELAVTDRAIRYLESGATMHPIVQIGEEIAYSDILVRVIIRNHIDSGISSPIIDYYRINVKEENEQ